MKKKSSRKVPTPSRSKAGAARKRLTKSRAATPRTEQTSTENATGSHSHSSTEPRSIKEILDNLKSLGFRLTRLRRFMLELLESSRGPLSVAEIKIAALQHKLRPNKTTIYRELYFLMEQGIVSEVDFLDGMKRYEFVAHDGHHHHMVCTACQNVECIDVCFDISRVLSEIATRSDFTVKHHVLEFFGLCAQCSESSVQ